jgi:hypothetical protein
MGETQTTPWRYKQALEFTGANTAEYFISYMLGRSFLTMRTEDILLSARYLFDLIPKNKRQKINIIAVGECGPAALHAMALEPELFDHLSLLRSLISWSNVIHTPVTRGAFINTIHGVLRYYDLPDLISLCGTERVEVRNPVNAENELIK